jgi:hypothetical protein
VKGVAFLFVVSISSELSEWREMSYRKEMQMHKKRVLTLAILSIPIFLITALGNAWAELKVGDEAPTFVLPSSQDKLVDYYKDYYGKHHLIITFFPAAFTPI